MGKDNSVEPHHPSNGVVREDYLQKGLPRCSQNYRLAKNYLMIYISNDFKD